MASDPVATAASHNPLLTKLVAAVGAANLGDTLNSQKAITVFAPYDPAFDALGADKFAALAKDPATLAPILQYHVLPTRMDADGLITAGSEKTLQGTTLKITGDKTSVEELHDLLKEPGMMEWNLEPQGTMKFAAHLYKTGTLKTQPKAWTDYYLPVAHDLKGN